MNISFSVTVTMDSSLLFGKLIFQENYREILMTVANSSIESHSLT
jgi:hypothetical protein